MAYEIVVVDYHKGNLQSVARSVVAAVPNADVTISDDPQTILEAGGIILPGVGAFEDAMRFIQESGQADAIRSSAHRGTPFLGICLGLQLLFEKGSELSSDQEGSIAQDGWAPGLGLIPGKATLLESSRLKVPHVGWDQIHLTDHGRACPLLVDVAEGSNVYFTHSYAVECDRPDLVAATTHYVRSFPSAVWWGNVYGVQFHPEKSSRTGLRILKNFVNVVRG